METQPKTKITLSLPKEAADKILKDFKDNPEKVKTYFKGAGFDIEDIIKSINN